jgi:quercetin dioxygenase-like cupin family protein
MQDEHGARAAGPVDLGRPGWTMLASNKTTKGSFELFEERRDATGGPPPHVHREREELFYVLEGRYVFVRDRDEIELVPGESIVIPRGTRHHYRTLIAPARTLILIVPAGLEGFFREMGVEIGAGRTPLEAMTALSARYDAHPVD